MTRLTDEEVWLRIYCSAITSAVDDRPSDVAESGLSEFRKRFPAEPSPAKAETGLVVEWEDTAHNSKAVYRDIFINAYAQDSTGRWSFQLELESGLDTFYIRRSDYPSRDSAKSAAVAELRKELGL